MGRDLLLRDSLQFLPAFLEQLAASLDNVGRGIFLKFQRRGFKCVFHGERYAARTKGRVLLWLPWLYRAARWTFTTTTKAFCKKLGDVDGFEVNTAHAQHVWENFYCSSLKEYITFNFLSNIFLLSDVFQAFRNNFVIEYQLNPAYFLSKPELL